MEHCEMTGENNFDLQCSKEKYDKGKNTENNVSSFQLGDIISFESQ